jgi:hypothetical protein
VCNISQPRCHCDWNLRHHDVGRDEGPPHRGGCHPCWCICSRLQILQYYACVPSGFCPSYECAYMLYGLVWCLFSASRVAIEQMIVYHAVGITTWHDMLVTPTSCGWR